MLKDKADKLEILLAEAANMLLELQDLIAALD
jgi:hypothetical protein